jgi:hypothetical protein
MNRLAVLLLVAMVGACASTEGAKKSWTGASYDDLVKAWGPPARSAKLADGADVHTWVSQGGPTYRSGPTVGFGIGSVGMGGGGRSTGVGVGASVPIGGDSVTPPSTCERTLTFRDGKLIDQSWIGPDELCSVYTR